MAGLGRELADALAGSDVVPRLIAEGPQPEWRLGALTVVVGEAQARLRYAREPVGTRARQRRRHRRRLAKALDRLSARSRPADELLRQLADAYRRARGRGGVGRVPLVDVRAAIAGTRARSSPGIWRGCGASGASSSTVCRIDIGVATGHAAARRSRVVWIEDDGGSGAWYETLRMIRQEEHG